MKTTQEYVDLLRSHADVLQREYGITSMILFGSVARGEHHEGSDVDVFVEMPPNLQSVGGAYIYLQKLLGCDVDLVRNHDHIAPLFRKKVGQYGVSIF